MGDLAALFRQEVDLLVEQVYRMHADELGTQAGLLLGAGGSGMTLRKFLRV